RFAQRLLINHHEAIRWLIPDRYFAFPGPGGRIYLNVKESSMMLARAFGLYELRKVKAVQALLKSGDTFIDVGGNKGDFALLAAKIVVLSSHPSRSLIQQRSRRSPQKRTIHVEDVVLPFV